MELGMQLEGYAQSTNVLNYSGMLFNKGNTRTPLSSIIGSKAKITNHIEFATGQEYATVGGDGPYKAISEEVSLDAPKETCITRTQQTNVTQIFHEAVGVSYVKQSNMGTLSGLNVVNQQENPISELDFQVAAKIQKINRDIEYAFINSKFQKLDYYNAKGEQNALAHSTRGLVDAITTNCLNVGGSALKLWDIAELVKILYEHNAPTDGLCLWCNATTLFQINADAVQNGLTVVPAAREINGISLSSVITPIGVVYLYLGECLPDDTALLLNLDVISPVYQPVPGKGNFFLEPLAKKGAGELYQLFGQIGLDHGPEWYHGKFIGISTKFAEPTHSRSVNVSNIGELEEILDAKSIRQKLQAPLKEAIESAKTDDLIKVLNETITDHPNNKIVNSILISEFKKVPARQLENLKNTIIAAHANINIQCIIEDAVNTILAELENNKKQTTDLYKTLKYLIDNKFKEKA